MNERERANHAALIAGPSYPGLFFDGSAMSEQMNRVMTARVRRLTRNEPVPSRVVPVIPCTYAENRTRR